MERFKAFAFVHSVRFDKHLHSNMERFKDSLCVPMSVLLTNLHSNMERFKVGASLSVCWQI